MYIYSIDMYIYVDTVHMHIYTFRKKSAKIVILVNIFNFESI